MTYSINGTSYQSSTTFSGLSAGTYSVTAKNSDGCISAPTSAVINSQPATPAAPTVSITQPNCTTATGTIVITAPTGAGMTYSINGTSYQSSTTFSGLSAGTYSVTAKNSAGCVSSPTNAVVNAQPATPSAPTVSVTQPSCSTPTGSITITAPIATGMTYSINWSTYQTGTTFSGLAVGSYSVTARNSAGCTSPATIVNLIAATNCNSAGTYPTATTCSSFKAGTTQLTEVCYTVKSGKVSNVTPGVFFYYSYVTAPSTSFTIDVVQTSLTAGFKLFGVQVSSNIAQVFLWDPTCNKIATGTQVSLGQARVSISNATPGRVYVISVKYDSKSILNSTPSLTSQIANYNFTLRVNSNPVSGTSVNLQAKPNNCVALRTIDGVDDEMASLVAYPNPTSGDFKVSYEMLEPGSAIFQLYDITGKLLLTREQQHEEPGQYQLDLSLTNAYMAHGLYFLRVIRDGRASELKILFTE
jgi:hypothetical protein